MQERKTKATEIKLATRIKRNANVMKNYRGKLQGLKAIDLIGQKQQEDAALARIHQQQCGAKSKIWRPDESDRQSL